MARNSSSLKKKARNNPKKQEITLKREQEYLKRKESVFFDFG